LVIAAMFPSLVLGLCDTDEGMAGRRARKRGNYGTLAAGSAAFGSLRAASSARERTPSLR
jgi:hypothetical protein